jgi:Leucine-rich repeat (LRR) protein
LLSKIDSEFLGANNLRGSIPEELKALSNLESLSITRNSFASSTGEVALLAHVGNIGFLSHLKFLDLSWNHLQGNFPSTFSDLTHLEHLALYHNRLGGSVGADFEALTNLKTLNLGENQLTGTIALEALSNLEVLVLDGFSDGVVDVQTQILPLTNLRELSMAAVEIHRDFRDGISQLSNLRVLFLQDVSMEGTISESFSRLPNLRALSLARNFLTGSIPASLRLLTNLQFFDLSDNELTGFIPPSLSEITQLTHLHLSENGLSGPVDFLCLSSAGDILVEIDCGSASSSNCTCCQCA